MLFRVWTRFVKICGGFSTARSRPQSAQVPFSAVLSIAPVLVATKSNQPILPAIDFHLSSRLASVAHLNTKAGRMPCPRNRPDARAKVMPKRLQITPKRCAINPAKKRSATSSTPAQVEIIRLLQPQPRCVPLDIRIAQAA